jgi:mono/diheme cytochrome c family protein
VRRLSAYVLALGVLALGACNSQVADGQADGAKVFEGACARCHGPNGRPDPGMVAKLGVKDLTQPALQARLSDADIRQQILKGSKNKQMPSFDGALTEPQIDAVIAHVRSLKSGTAPKSPSP